MLSVVTYTITVTNLGPDATTGVEITDSLPVGLTFVSSQPGQGTYSNVSGVWTVGVLALNGTATLTVNARVNTGTTGQNLVNTATVTHNDNFDPVPPNNTSTVTITPLPCSMPVQVSVPVATPSPAAQGQIVTFTDVASDPENRCSRTPGISATAPPRRERP